jgi:hypothetical protein
LVPGGCGGVKILAATGSISPTPPQRDDATFSLARPLDRIAANDRISAVLFRTQRSGVIAISQLTHAWISGELLRAWDEELSHPILLSAEQHDLGWIDWEVAPSFDAQSGRPHLFRDVGASLHAPMWAKGVDRALGAWGTHVALLISRHGGVIYRRFTSRHRLAEADSVAMRHYLETQGLKEQAWARALGLDEARLRRESALIAFVDTLSLALCGELPAPLDIEAPDRGAGIRTLRLTERPGCAFDFVLSPWPFRESVLIVEGEARPLPSEGRFSDEDSMRIWLAAPERVKFTARLASS